MAFLGIAKKASLTTEEEEEGQVNDDTLLQNLVLLEPCLRLLYRW
jgi:hypothetical protein